MRSLLSLQGARMLEISIICVQRSNIEYSETTLHCTRHRQTPAIPFIYLLFLFFIYNTIIPTSKKSSSLTHKFRIFGTFPCDPVLPKTFGHGFPSIHRIRSLGGKLRRRACRGGNTRSSGIRPGLLVRRSRIRLSTGYYVRGFRPTIL